MAEPTKFQQMNGCSACKHAAQEDAEGKPAAALGAGFWCKHLKKPVNSKDGSSCPDWAFE